MWLAAGTVPGGLMYVGWLDAIASYLQIAFFVCIGFTVLSLLLSLFEEVGEPIAPESLPHPREFKALAPLPATRPWALRGRLQHSH